MYGSESRLYHSGRLLYLHGSRGKAARACEKEQAYKRVAWRGPPVKGSLQRSKYGATTGEESGSSRKGNKIKTNSPLSITPSCRCKEAERRKLKRALNTLAQLVVYCADETNEDLEQFNKN